MLPEQPLLAMLFIVPRGKTEGEVSFSGRPGRSRARAGLLDRPRRHAYNCAEGTVPFGALRPFPRAAKSRLAETRYNGQHE